MPSTRFFLRFPAYSMTTSEERRARGQLKCHAPGEETGRVGAEEEKVLQPCRHNRRLVAAELTRRAPDRPPGPSPLAACPMTVRRPLGCVVPGGVGARAALLAKG